MSVPIGSSFSLQASRPQMLLLFSKNFLLSLNLYRRKQKRTRIYMYKKTNPNINLMVTREIGLTQEQGEYLLFKEDKQITDN